MKKSSPVHMGWWVKQGLKGGGILPATAGRRGNQSEETKTLLGRQPLFIYVG